MTPVFRLLALVKSPDGKTIEEKNITARILPHLVSLTLTDNAGLQADTLNLVLADTAKATVIPEPDTILRLSLGFKNGTLRDMGDYALDEVKWSDPPAQFSLTARSAVHSDEGTPAGLPPMQTKKTRSWEAGTKLADMVAKIATEHALKPFVGASLQNVTLPHTDQTDETDLNLLQRIVAERGGWAKVTHGLLSLVTNAAAEAAADHVPASDAPAPHTIRPGGYTSIDWTNKKRQHYRRVIAVWRDMDAATDREVTVGDASPDAPADRLRKPHPDEQTAILAAKSRLEQIAREGKALNVTFPAPSDMSPSADAPLIISGIAPQIDGRWMPKVVTWSLSRSGLACAVQCETTTT